MTSGNTKDFFSSERAWHVKEIMRLRRTYRRIEDHIKARFQEAIELPQGGVAWDWGLAEEILDSAILELSFNPLLRLAKLQAARKPYGTEAAQLLRKEEIAYGVLINSTAAKDMNMFLEAFKRWYVASRDLLVACKLRHR